MPRKIDLNGRGNALVDDDDYERVIAAGPWYTHPKGYAQNRDRIFMHRLILGLMPGDGKRTDHINGNGLDNRRCNLRLATRKQNQRNKKKRSDAWQSRFKGVSTYRRGRRKRWQAYIKFDGRQRHLGYFATEEEAARAYDAAAKKHFGEFARLNFAT